MLLEAFPAHIPKGKLRTLVERGLCVCVTCLHPCRFLEAWVLYRGVVCYNRVDERSGPSS